MRKETIFSEETTFTCVFEPAPEGGYVVTCPAPPGLVTEGDSLDEARPSAPAALRSLSVAGALRDWTLDASPASMLRDGRCAPSSA